MTILLTEIHYHNRPEGLILFGADRRISVGTQRDSEQPKIFPIPKLSAGIGYFGLAEVPAPSGVEPMAAWLARYLKASKATTLAEMAQELTNELNAAVPIDWRRKDVSGFHLCGFARENHPEFWFVRNFDDDYKPTGVFAPREDFQRRDLHGLRPDAAQQYRNGDIRPLVKAWEKIDDAFNDFKAEREFDLLRTSTQYEQWVRFKIEVIAQFYERFCSESIIGRPVDVFSVRWK